MIRRLSLLSAALLLTAVLRLSAQVELTVCTYNVLSFEVENQELSGGKKFQMQYFYDAFKELNADIYAVNELEILTSRTGPRHLLSDLAGELGMYSAFGESYPKEEGLYGNGLISRFPILSVRSKLLPKPTGSADQRSVMWADVLHPSGQVFRVIVTHLDHVGGQEEQLQAIARDKEIVQCDYPMILMGDMNMDAYFVDKVLEGQFEKKATNWVDYIGVGLGNGSFTAKGTRIEPFDGLSDHFAVLTRLTYEK